MGVTWSGRALLVDNGLSHHWKGMGAFVDAEVEAHNDTVHHHVGWGAWVTQRAEAFAPPRHLCVQTTCRRGAGGAEVSGVFSHNAVAFDELHSVKAYPEDTSACGAAARRRGLLAHRNLLHGNLLHESVTAGAPVEPHAYGTDVSADPQFLSEQDLRPAKGSPLETLQAGATFGRTRVARGPGPLSEGEGDQRCGGGPATSWQPGRAR